MALVTIALPIDGGDDPGLTTQASDEAFEGLYKARGFGTVVNDKNGKLVWDTKPTEAAVSTSKSGS